MSEDKVRTKDSCWSVGTIYDLKELPRVSTADPGVNGVLHKEIFHPDTPTSKEHSIEENLGEAIPINRIEGFVEINLKDNRGDLTGDVVGADVHCVGVVLCNTSFQNKTNLISTNKVRDERLKSTREDFRYSFNGAVLKANRTHFQMFIIRHLFLHLFESNSYRCSGFLQKN
jgi:hypothetical protein